MTSKRKERQAKLIETFRRLNADEGNDNESKKQEIIRETMAQMLKDFYADFPNDGFDEGQEYERYLLTLLEDELSNDYEDLFQREINEEESIEADLDLQNAVSCFACQKSTMNFEYNATHSKIACRACTFTLIKPGHILPEQLNERFANIVNQHGHNCRSVFHFEPHGDFNQCENLQILCHVSCNLFCFVFHPAHFPSNFPFPFSLFLNCTSFI